MSVSLRSFSIGILILIIILVSAWYIHNTFPSKVTFERPLIVGIIDYPPYSYMLDDYPTGTGVEIVKEAFKRLDLDIDIQLYVWNDLINDVRTGKADVIVDVYKTSDRSDYLTFSKSHYGVYPLYFFKRSEDNIRYNGDLNIMSDYTIGLVKGFYYGDIFEQASLTNSFHIREYASPSINMDKLLAGDVDLVIETLYSGQSLIRDLRATESIGIIEPEIEFLYSYVGFSKANNLTLIRDAYDKVINEMKEDGTYQEIYLQYSPGETK